MIVQRDYQKSTLAGVRGTSLEKAHTYGSWNVAAGGLFSQCFDDAGGAFTVPIDVNMIPHTWKMSDGFDYGSSAPWAYLIVAISDGSPIKMPDGKSKHFKKGDMVVVGEVYGCERDRPNVGLNMTADLIKREIIAFQNEIGVRYQDHAGRWRCWIKQGCADDTIFSKKLSDDSVETFDQYFAKQTVQRYSASRAHLAARRQHIDATEDGLEFGADQAVRRPGWHCRRPLHRPQLSTLAADAINTRQGQRRSRRLPEKQRGPPGRRAALHGASEARIRISLSYSLNDVRRR